MPPLCDEVWLNTANSQFHIALATALCLALEAPSGWSGRLRRVLLFFAPLCGPITVALTPLFVLRAVRDRQRARALQAACLLAGALPQLAIMALAPMHERGKLIGPTTITCIFSSLCTAANRWVAHGAKIVLAWLLAVSVWQTIPPQDPVYSQGPLWRLEVARLRTDPAYAPRIWPDGWRVKL